MACDNQQLYIVVSQTGTVLSRILKLITGAEYNHSSLALSRDLKLMYSFGRMNPYNPFYGGFVTESADFGTFKRFNNTKIMVLALDITENKHKQIGDMIDTMLAERKKYKYNYMGLVLAALGLVIKQKNRYYCSEFVREVLIKSDIEGANKLCGIIKPVQFMDIPHIREIYCGKLSDYAEFYQKSFASLNY